jgi:hypothetical protein
MDRQTDESGQHVADWGTQAIKQFRETSTADQIAILETQRGHLVQHKAAMERKLDLFREKVKERAEEKGK